MKQKNEKPNAAKLRSTPDGLHLNGSILWFDSHNTGQLSFLSSSLSTTKTNVPQVITTEETSKILELYRRKPNALICQYNRPFSIGKLKMELLPSGSVLGGASLYVENDKGRLFYAAQLQTHKVPTIRQMQLKQAQSLVLNAQLRNPSQAFPNRKKELDNLLSKVGELHTAGTFPTILCSSLGTAQEITKLLSENNIPIAVHSSIARINKVYDSFGSQLGRYSTFSTRRTRKKSVLWPLLKANYGKNIAFPDGPFLLVKDEPIEHEFEGMENMAGSFVISTASDGTDLKEVISAIQPSELFLFGPFAKAYADEFKGLVRKIAPLYDNDQPTLF